MQIREYIDRNDRSPFGKWLKTLDKKTQARIQARISRFAEGNLGDTKIISEGVFEARFFFGPGYRLYYGIDKGTIILLLCGGDKSTQSRDIEKAKKYWLDYKEESKK